jgi:hypothetical protein
MIQIISTDEFDTIARPELRNMPGRPVSWLPSLPVRIHFLKDGKHRFVKVFDDLIQYAACYLRFITAKGNLRRIIVRRWANTVVIPV